MNLVALDIPDHPAALAGWLEAHLMGLDLAALVAELAAAHGPPAGRTPPLDELLGPFRSEVLARGLAALPPERLRGLLCRPDALPALQELVLVEEGSHWQGRASPAADALARRGARRLESVFRPKVRLPARWYFHPAVVSLATAAGILLAVYLARRVILPRGEAVGWGWDRPGAVAQTGPPAAYLNRLADAAGEWFQERPDDPVALARRMGELRQGCSTLILAPHRPLPDEERLWLVAHCREWAGQLDKQRAALEAGRPAAEVRDQADSLVKEIGAALRARAEAIGTG
jgi:hypothetical protein